MITSTAAETTQAKVQCRMIRSKWMFIEVEPDPTVPHTESNICWCVHTQKCIGPDGQIVTPEACNSDRYCFEAL